MSDLTREPPYYRWIREIDDFRSYRATATRRRSAWSYLAIRVLDILSRLEQLPRAYGRG